MFFISTEGKTTLINRAIKKARYIDFFSGEFDSFQKEKNLFIKTLYVGSKYGNKYIVLKYRKITNNIFEIISID